MLVLRWNAFKRQDLIPPVRAAASGATAGREERTQRQEISVRAPVCSDKGERAARDVHAPLQLLPGHPGVIHCACAARRHALAS